MKNGLPLYALLLAACGTAPRTEHAAAPSRPDMLAACIDTTVKPGDDFFQWATGAWMKNNPIPASESSWDMGHLVYEELYAIKRRINEKAAANTKAEGDEKKVGDFWTVAMDSVKADQLGATPIAQELAMIDAIKTPAARSTWPRS